jgi:electron transfer flavoprotein-quinone oxidoreductase
VLASAGLEVAVIERGQSPGAKNVTGGRLYAHSLERIIPGFAKQAPVERLITKERIMLMTEKNATAIEYNLGEKLAPDKVSYSVLRSAFDAWYAEKAENAGAMYVPGIRVDKLHQVDGKVCGVVADGDVLEADAVILADGVNSLLAQKIGLKKELLPQQVAVGVKEVIELGEDKISERFGLSSGEGAACLISGYPTGGATGGGFMYTNKSSISIGTVATLRSIGEEESIKVPDMIERLKAHPSIAPLIEGGEPVEYSAHLVPEGGYYMMPQLYWNGVLLAGDAAGFVMNMGYTFRGMDLAIESGKLAAETVIRAKSTRDFSAEGLSYYRTLLDRSFIMRDLMRLKDAPALMDMHAMYNELPQLADSIMKELFIQDGVPKERLVSSITKKARGVISTADLARLGTRAYKAL